MRILYASERPPYPFFLGGAARCAHQLLRKMSGELHIECMAASSSDYSVAPWSYPVPSEFDVLGVRAVSAKERGGTVDCGYPIELFPDFHDGLGRLIDTFRPDVVWTQLEGARAILEFAKRKGVQGILFVHDAEFDPADLRAIGDLGSHVVCSSRFLARKAREVIRREVGVVYPCPETHFGVTGDRNGHITMINPHRVKGIATFIEIAKRLPKERFLLVESWKLNDQDAAALNRQIAEVANIRYIRRVPDMRQIYGQTRLMLVPSMWEEGFGMVAIEAQSCGIPVIASARGGLPESVGDGGVLIEEYRSVDAWMAAIGEVIGDERNYDAYAARARRHALAEEFTVASSARCFVEACSVKATPRSGLSRSLRGLIDHLVEVPGLGRLIRWASR